MGGTPTQLDVLGFKKCHEAELHDDLVKGQTFSETQLHLQSVFFLQTSSPLGVKSFLYNFCCHTQMQNLKK